MLFLAKDDNSGQGLVEYGLLMMLACLIILTTFLLLGPIVGNVFGNITVSGLEAAEPPQRENIERVWQSGGMMYGIYVQDGYAYIGVGTRLEVIDVTNPMIPTKVGESESLSSHHIIDIYVSGDYAYVTNEFGGLYIMDIHEPTNPVIVSRVETDSFAVGIQVIGTYAYLANGLDGLRVFEVSDPSQPREIARLDTPGFAQSVTVVDGYAYVADHHGGLQVIDVQNPENPQLITQYEIEGWAYEITIANQKAYIGVGQDIYGDEEEDIAVFYILDISDPTQPTTVATYKKNDLIEQYYAPYGPLEIVGIQIAGNYAYLSTNSRSYGGVIIFNITDSTTQQIGVYDSSFMETFISDNHLYIHNPSGELAIFDLQKLEPDSSPTYIDSYRPSWYNILFADQNIVYLGSGEHMHVWDTNNTSNITPLETFNLSKWANKFIHVDNDYGYLDVYSGLYILNISNPSQPQIIGYYRKSVTYITSDYGYGYDDTNDQLFVLDLQDRSNPTVVGSYEVPTSSNYKEIQVELPYLYLLNYHNNANELLVFNIEDKTNLILVGRYEFVGRAEKMQVNDRYAHFLIKPHWIDGTRVGEYAIQTLSLITPTHPTLVASYKIDADYVSSFFKLINESLLIETGYYNLQVIDVSDPTQLRLSNTYPLSGYISVFDYQGPYIYIGQENFSMLNMPRLTILNFTNPQQPEQVGFYEMPLFYDLTVDNNRIYITDREDGLYILEDNLLHEPSPTPNPTVTTTPLITITPTITPTPTSTMTVTATASATPLITITPTITPTATPTVTPDPSTHTIPETGGSLTELDGKLSLTFPDNALTTTVNVRVTAIETSTHALPQAYLSGTMFDIDVSNLAGEPITKLPNRFTLQVFYDEQTWQQLGVLESQLNLYYWDEANETWEAILPCSGCEHNEENNQFLVQLDHLTSFAILGQKAEATYLPMLRK